MSTDTSRRKWLRNLGTATAVAAVPGTVRAGARKVQDVRARFAPTARDQQHARELVTTGQELFDEWTVVAAPGLYYGAVPVILRTKDGHEFQVDVLRHDSTDVRRPIAQSGELAIFVVNGGNGRVRTREIEGRGALALAMYLDANPRPVPVLMTLSQRSTEFGNGGFVLLDEGAAQTEHVVADRLG